MKPNHAQAGVFNYVLCTFRMLSIFVVMLPRAVGGMEVQYVSSQVMVIPIYTETYLT
jgi:hypothetical protein